MEEISKDVADYYGISIEDIHSSSRKAVVVNARRVIMLAARKSLNKSLEQIAKYFNTTAVKVAHHLKVATQENIPSIKLRLLELMERIEAGERNLTIPLLDAWKEYKQRYL